MADVIKTFRNVRARLYRRDSGVWLGGWVKHLAQDTARLKLKAYTGLTVGEALYVQCTGDGTLVHFDGVHAGQMGQEIMVRIDSALCYEPSRESIRILVEGSEGALYDDNRRCHLILMDVSPNGLGGIVNGLFTPSATASITIPSEDGDINATVKIMNCQSDGTQAGYYRVGMLIHEMGRLDQARWRRFVQMHIDA